MWTILLSVELTTTKMFKCYTVIIIVELLFGPFWNEGMFKCISCMKFKNRLWFNQLINNILWMFGNMNMCVFASIVFMCLYIHKTETVITSCIKWLFSVGEKIRSTFDQAIFSTDKLLLMNYLITGYSFLVCSVHIVARFIVEFIEKPCCIG